MQRLMCAAELEELEVQRSRRARLLQPEALLSVVHGLENEFSKDNTPLQPSDFDFSTNGLEE